MKRQIVIVPAVVAIWLSFVASRAGGEVRYTVTDIGVLPGYTAYVQAMGINNNGQIVGYCQRSGDWKNHAFLWQRDTGLQDIGTLGGTDAMALGINNCGQIVGGSTNNIVFPSDPKGHHFHAFLWQNSSGMHDILNDGGYKSYGRGINDNGQVVGVYRGLDCDGDPSNPYAFIWQNGGVPQIFAPGFEPSGINNAGQVAGRLSRNGKWGAYIWQSSTGLQNIGTLSGDNNAFTSGINDKGEVVGYSWSTTSYRSHAFLWQQNNGMQDLGSLSSNGCEASDINNNGQIVGTSNNCAFIWQSGTGMVDLNTLVDPSSGWVLNEAIGINDNGWIIGSGTNPAGDIRAFLLTPVPEPSTLVLMGVAAVSLRHARRQKHTHPV